MHNPTDPTFVLDSTAANLILLQRTQYRQAVDDMLIAAVGQMYHDDIAREFETIRSHLPIACERSLDIGAGVGGIDWFLYQHYRGSLDLHILDRDGVSDAVYYGFNPTAAKYNYLGQTAEFLERNGVPRAKLHMHDVETSGFPTSIRFDLIVSLLSWGFHYPVDVYADAVAAVLSPSGTAILDVRKETDGMAQLQRRFSRGVELLDAPKFTRIAVSV
jgi:hypothetical protein